MASSSHGNEKYEDGLKVRILHLPACQSNLMQAMQAASAPG